MNKWSDWKWKGRMYVNADRWGGYNRKQPCISVVANQFYVSQPFENCDHPAFHYSGPYETLSAAKSAYLMLFDDALDMR